MTVRHARQIERCFNRTDRIWLTFDDGGTRAQVLRILATLRRNHVRGHFFFTGIWGRGNPGLLRRIRREGHVVGNHSYSHPALSQESASGVLGQLDRGTRAAGAPKLLRPPFAAGALTRRLETLAAGRGYKLCRWTVDTYDWQGASTARMVERIRRGDELTPPIARGGNILMHGTAPHTSVGLQRIIDAVRAEKLVLDALPASRSSDAPSTPAQRLAERAARR
jgi:peptidoglycan/xylan/chitin deacetylase (PgdA/CDA1 family)